MKRASIVIASVLISLSWGLASSASEAPPKSLQEAAGSGDLEQLKRHIDKGSDLNKADQYGYTPLKRAMESHQVEAAKLLIEAGANVNTKDRDGVTPLITGALNGQTELVEMLLAKGADKNAKDNSERTALHAAVQMSRTDIVDILVKAGADVNAQCRGQTPLSMATQRNLTEIAGILRQAGATMPTVANSPYGDYGGYEQGGAEAGAYVAAPVRVDIEVDPNAIRKQMQEFPDLTPALAAVDKNSQNEQRAWIQQRIDNRTSLIGAVEKQFGDDLAFIKKVATAEKAAETTKAIDELAVRRKERYAAIADALREQRREMLRQSREMMGGRGAYSGRGGRTSRSSRSTSTQDSTSPYGYGDTAGTRTPTRRHEPNEPQLDAETQSQIQAWLNAKPDDKKGLMEATYDLDESELGAVHQIATEEEAKKTCVAIMAVLMVRQERNAKVAAKWLEDEERMRRLQERLGTNNTQGTPGAQPGMRTGRRGR